MMEHELKKPSTGDANIKSYVHTFQLKGNEIIHTGVKLNTSETSGTLFPKAVRPKKKPFSCDVCDKSYAYEQNFKKHMSVHTGEKAYNCHTCDKWFHRASDFRKHTMFFHKVEKTNTCGNCGQCFIRATDLHKHMLVHTEKYTCKSCGKGFTKASDLQKHENKHTGDKPYTCGSCGKSYASAYSLKKHLLAHKEKTQYEPHHAISNNVVYAISKPQISLGICAV